MLRLNQLYFRNYFFLFFTTLLVVAIFGHYMLKNLEIENHRIMLVNMIDIIDQNDLTHFEKKAQEIKEKTGVRVTVINDKGQVIIESDRDIQGMANHNDREEVIQAHAQTIGSSVRYSESIKNNFLYVAKVRDINNSEYIIRMAYSLENINEKFYSFWSKALFFFALAMLLAFVVALKINNHVTQDVEVTKERLKDLVNKNFEITPYEAHTKEFDAILHHLQQISKKLKKREVQKQKYTKNLKLLNKKQSDIISAISHEFKNPIAAIIGYAQTLNEDPQIDPNIRERFLYKISNNASKISNMIDRLSMAVKLDNEDFKPKFSHFKLKPLLLDVKEILEQKYKERQIILDVDDTDLHADKTMIENLFINLIENALKYSEEEVIVTYRENRISVIDKGIGIQEKDLENITKRFFRAGELSWDNSIGVGLYIVKFILKLHSSYLEIESTPEVGSTFSFDITPMLDTIKPA